MLLNLEWAYIMAIEILEDNQTRLDNSMTGIFFEVSRLVDGMQTQKNLVEVALMLGILSSVALTVILFVQLGYKTFFNDQSQLIIDD